MNITVNAIAHDLAAETVEAALTELGFAAASVATALNGSFVPRAARPAARLSPGDRLEVLAPMQGG